PAGHIESRSDWPVGRPACSAGLDLLHQERGVTRLYADTALSPPNHLTRRGDIRGPAPVEVRTPDDDLVPVHRRPGAGPGMGDGTDEVVQPLAGEGPVDPFVPRAAPPEVGARQMALGTHLRIPPCQALDRFEHE